LARLEVRTGMIIGAGAEDWCSVECIVDVVTVGVTVGTDEIGIDGETDDCAEISD